MKKIILSLILSSLSLGLYADCNNVNVRRIVEDAYQRISNEMEKFDERIPHRYSEQCKGDWLLNLFPEISHEIKRMHNSKLSCGIVLSFPSERKMKDFFAEYLFFNKESDHYVTIDFLSGGVDIALCGVIE